MLLGPEGGADRPSWISEGKGSHDFLSGHKLDLSLDLRATLARRVNVNDESHTSGMLADVSLLDERVVVRVAVLVVWVSMCLC